MGGEKERKRWAKSSTVLSMPIIPPIIPAISPENNGAPLAKAIPKHKGNATKNTTTLAGRSFLMCLNICK